MGDEDGPLASLIRDEILANKLKQFAVSATKVVVLNTCHAGGYVFTHGTGDLHTVTNITALMSVPEPVPCPGADAFEAGLQDALNTDRKADSDGNGKVFAQEWFNVGKAAPNAAAQDPKFFSNLDAAANVPIFSVPPGVVGGTAGLLSDSESPRAEGTGQDGTTYAPFAVALAGALVALAGGGWYTRRRWMR